jgi:UDP-3-O-[3-hydroxymyristoyl] glucosamine N-acyltransferase
MTIQPFVTIGNNVTLWSGNHIGHHSRIGDNCFLTSHVVVSGGVEIGNNCFLGVNATIRDHIKIASHCVVGANTLILKDTQEKGVYIGNPAELSKVPSDRLKKL